MWGNEGGDGGEVVVRALVVAEFFGTPPVEEEELEVVGGEVVGGEVVNDGLAPVGVAVLGVVVVGVGETL